MIPASASSRNPISRTMSRPRIGCSWIAAYSSSVSFPVFCRTLVGTPSLPTSCSMPAYLMASTRSPCMPISRAIMTEPRETRSLCPRV